MGVDLLIRHPSKVRSQQSIGTTASRRSCAGFSTWDKIYVQQAAFLLEAKACSQHGAGYHAFLSRGNVLCAAVGVIRSQSKCGYLDRALCSCIFKVKSA